MLGIEKGHGSGKELNPLVNDGVTKEATKTGKVVVCKFFPKGVAKVVGPLGNDYQN